MLAVLSELITNGSYLRVSICLLVRLLLKCTYIQYKRYQCNLKSFRIIRLHVNISFYIKKFLIILMSLVGR